MNEPPNHASLCDICDKPKHSYDNGDGIYRCRKCRKNWLRMMHPEVQEDYYEYLSEKQE